MKPSIIVVLVLSTFVSCVQKKSLEELDDSKLFTLIPPETSGVDFINNLTEDKENNHFINDMFVAGAGVAVACGRVGLVSTAPAHYRTNGMIARRFLG